MKHNLSEVLGALEELPKYDVKPGLNRIEFLLEELGHPERNFRSIHIAGSNGKGSVLALLAAVLRQDNLVGEFLSPPLVDFSDRIKVDGENIDEGSIASGVEKLEKPIQYLRDKDNEPSYFEAVTALSAWYFAEEGVDLALLEAGLGGKYDATNPVGRSLLSLVTSVDLEHQKILGNSIEEIGRELAGIAKEDKPLVVGPCENFPRKVFESEKNKVGFKIIPAGERTEVQILDFDWDTTRYRIEKSPWEELVGEEVEIGLSGTYQEKNLTTALTTLGELDDLGYPVEPEGIKKGLEGASWPGRFQVLDKNPHVLVDGAHNEAATELLAGELERYKLLRPEESRTELVFTALKDKNIKGMLSALAPVVDGIYLTELDLPRAAPAGVLEQTADELGLNYRTVSSPRGAIDTAREEVSEGDLICITGSLYLVREAIVK